LLSRRGTVLPQVLARVGALTAWGLAAYLFDKFILQPGGRQLPIRP
jgi:hypothetical protein